MPSFLPTRGAVFLPVAPNTQRYEIAHDLVNRHARYDAAIVAHGSHMGHVPQVAIATAPRYAELCRNVSGTPIYMAKNSLQFLRIAPASGTDAAVSM